MAYNGNHNGWPIAFKNKVLLKMFYYSRASLSNTQKINFIKNEKKKNNNHNINIMPCKPDIFKKQVIKFRTENHQKSLLLLNLVFHVFVHYVFVYRVKNTFKNEDN